MGKWIEKLKKKQQEMRNQYRRGKNVTEQMKAEKLRKKLNKRMNMKPGARKAISDGLANRDSPMNVMRKEYQRRKELRKKK